MLIVKCPFCSNMMKVDPRVKDIRKAKKRCVYCGRTFSIHTSPNNSRIVKVI